MPENALAHDGVWAVITGEDVRKLSDPFLAAVKAPVQQWTLAVERVRYVGEPVAVVVAESRYVAEDAAELVTIDYQPLDVVLDPVEACKSSAPLLHPQAGTNEISVREFRYGDPDGAFARADRRIAMTVPFPRLSFTPIECYVVVAQHNAAENSYDVLANFQGPFSMHPVMARALRVPGPKLRLRIPPDSGGSFGIKLSIFPYIVLIALAARITGRPVKWTEDRIEHLVAASCGPNRVTEIEAAVGNDGRVLGLKLDQLEDYGAFLRAPMPGPLYRMHGAVTGAYDIAHVEVKNRVVLTNKMPASLIRGFGGPQLYLALERLMDRIAIELRLDPLDVIRRNLIPAQKFPYRTAAGALYDSGDYGRAVDIATADGRLADLKKRREAAHGARPALWHRLCRRGRAGHVEYGLSLDADDAAGARKSRPKERRGVDGAPDDRSAWRGHGHRRRHRAGPKPRDRAGADRRAGARPLGRGGRSRARNSDTAKDQWSIAAGTYSSRFASGTAVAAHMAAVAMRDKLKAIAAKQLNVLPDDVELAGGKIRSRSNPDNALPFGRVAGTSHWSPVMLPEGTAPALSETAVWTPPELEPPSSDDRINTSLTYGFIFDMCGVEIDPVTYHVRVDRYVSMHDAGRIMNPMIAEGQIRGAFAQGIAAALYEEFTYNEEGAFLNGTFADYLVPTVGEIPDVEILHHHSPSPFTPLGAKGLAEGNCMSTPACIANAIADALGARDIVLPATPRRIHALLKAARQSGGSRA